MDWFKDLIARVRAAFSSASTAAPDDFRLVPLDARRPLKKDEEYVTVRLLSSSIPNKREWNHKVHGCVHARGAYLNDRGRAPFNTVVAPTAFKDLDAGRLDRVAVINKPVLGPVPFLDPIELQIALFTVKAVDLAAPYIELLTGIADIAGVGFSAMAKAYAEPLNKGAALLFGRTGDSTLEVGIENGMAAAETGTWLLMRAPATVSLAGLKLDPNDNRLKNAAGEPFLEYPYLVFAVEASTERANWMEIPDLKEAWEAIGTAAKAGQVNDAEKLLKAFEIACLWSPDLIRTDADRLVEKARKRLPALQPRHGASRVLATDPHPLGSFADLNLYG